MRILSRILLFSLPVAFVSHASCQVRYLPAYIITNENDTVNGIAGYKSKENSDLCLFKTDEKSEPTEYRPFDIKGYRFIDGEYYISKKVTVGEESKDLFLEYLVDGIASLYYHLDNEGNHYFIEREDGTMYELNTELIKSSTTYYTDHSYYESKRYIGILKATFSDCPEIQEDLNKARLDHKSLIELTSAYHGYVCETEECIIYSKMGPYETITLGPVIGYHMTSFSMSENEFWEDISFDKSNHFDYGVRFNLRLPFLNGNTSFDLAPTFGGFTLKGHRVFEDFTYTKYDSLYIDAKYFETTLSCKYLLQKKDLRPGLFVGLGWMKVIKPDLYRTTRNIFESSETYLDYEGDIPLPLSFISFHGGAELNYKIGKRSSAFVDVIYAYYRGIYDTSKLPNVPYTAVGDKIKSVMQSIILKAGIYF